MFGLSLGKLFVIAMVIVALWRGLRMLQQLRTRIDVRDAAREREARLAQARRTEPATTDLAPCPRCGTFVPPGTFCPSDGPCRLRHPA